MPKRLQKIIIWILIKLIVDNHNLFVPHFHKTAHTKCSALWKYLFFILLKYILYFVHNLTWGRIKLSFSMCVYPLSSPRSAPCKLRHCADNFQRFIYGKDETRQPDDVSDFIFHTFWLRCQWSLNISLSFPSFMALETLSVPLLLSL